MLVATEVRRRESLVDLPCSRNPGSQMVGKADRKKLRENRVRAGGRRKGQLAAARLSALT